MINNTLSAVPRKALTILASGLSSQNHLGALWVPSLIKLTPPKYRRELALRILAISPHYFYPDEYASDLGRSQTLEAEYQRNTLVRKQMAEQILKPHLDPEMTVMDFGCGPGWLAKEVATYCHSVVAVDISCGTIACAQALNARDNIAYLVNRKGTFSEMRPASIDFIYTFAVFQHLTDAVMEKTLKDFFVVLKQGGKVLCHVAMDDYVASNSPSPLKNVLARLAKEQYGLRTLFRREDNVIEMIVKAGFTRPTVVKVKDVGDLEDDIMKDRLFIFKKEQAISSQS